MSLQELEICLQKMAASEMKVPMRLWEQMFLQIQRIQTIQIIPEQTLFPTVFLMVVLICRQMIFLGKTEMKIFLIRQRMRWIHRPQQMQIPPVGFWEK